MSAGQFVLVRVVSNDGYTPHEKANTTSAGTTPAGTTPAGTTSAGEAGLDRQRLLDQPAHVLAVPQSQRPPQRVERALAVHQLQAQAPEALPRARVGGAAQRGALGGLLGEVDGADVFVDPRGEAVGGRAAAVDARPVAHRARGL